MSEGDPSVEFRRELVRRLRFQGNLRSERVASAFEAVPREVFVPDFVATSGLAAAYADVPIVVKLDERGAPISSSSQPAIMATMLDLLDVTDGARVLEIGAGTGYNAALLAHLAGSAGSVTAVELDDDLGRRASAALQSIGSPAKVVVGDGREGWPTDAPYDRVIVTASTADIPKAWCDQLADGGVLVAPLRPTAVFGAQVVAALRKRGDQLESLAIVPGAFMGLRDVDGALAPRGSDSEQQTARRISSLTGVEMSWELTVFLALGGADSEDAARELVDEWDERGSPSVGRLHVVVGFDESPPIAWRTQTRPSGWITFDWQ